MEDCEVFSLDMFKLVEQGSSAGSSSTSEATSVSFPVPPPISVVEDVLESNPGFLLTVFEFGEPPDEDVLLRCFFFFFSAEGGTISG